MKINNNQITGLDRVKPDSQNNPALGNNTDNKKNSNNDTVSISVDLKKLTDKAKESSGINQALVDKYKGLIEKGEYKINSEQLASRILKNQF